MQLAFEEMVPVDLLRDLTVSDPDETLVLDAETAAGADLLSKERRLSFSLIEGKHFMAEFYRL